MARALAEFQSKRHGPEVSSEGLARSTPRFGGCSVRVPLLASFRTSTCHRPQSCGSWSGRRTDCRTGHGPCRRIGASLRSWCRQHPAKDGAFPKTRMFGAVFWPWPRRGSLPGGLLLFGLRLDVAGSTSRRRRSRREHCLRRGRCSWMKPFVPPSHGRGERVEMALVDCLQLDFRLGWRCTRAPENGHYEQQLAV